MELNTLYQEVILDHYKRPHHKGLTAGDIQVHHINPSCGDEITLSLKMNSGKVDSITWDGMGCSISQASVSIMSDLLIGKSAIEAEAILDSFVSMMQSKGADQGDEEILEDGVALAGVSKYPARIKCALLGWMAYKDAVTQVGEKQ
jgi:nitrogen fixation NifU-like protein